MKCKHCGAWTSVKETRQASRGYVLKRRRQCANACPPFTTYEVLDAVWGSIKTPNGNAARAAERRAHTYKRNRKMAALLRAGVEGKEVARLFGVSTSTVSLVRKAFLSKAASAPARSSSSANGAVPRSASPAAHGGIASCAVAHRRGPIAT